MKSALLLALATALASGCAQPHRSDTNAAQHAAIDSRVEVLRVEDVQWTPLNPARGDQSPQAGTLWGDRNATGPTGFLVRFADGFSSPPHIHNVTYRGVVISGLVHNDDPDAAEMWMPPGSYWTQPKGEAHITAAKGSVNVAYIEIEEGPYLVQPTEEAFDRGERPVNVDASNIVWLDASNTRWIASNDSHGPAMAFLWGDPIDGQLSGSLIKLPAGFRGEIRTSGTSFRAVIARGNVTLSESELAAEALRPGSSFGSNGKAVHRIESGSEEESLLYVRTRGVFEFVASR